MVEVNSVVPPPVPDKAPPEQDLDPRYSKLICFNCGDPGHFVGNCVRPKLCFICNLPGHPVYSCPEWNKEHPVADYFGSANSGLRFYHIDVPDANETQCLNFRNCGVIQIKKVVVMILLVLRLWLCLMPLLLKWTLIPPVPGSGTPGVANPTPNITVGARTCALEETLVIDVSNINFTDHMSWNGEDCADKEFVDNLISMDSPCSVPGHWDYDRMDDNVWDFDPSSLDSEDKVEVEATSTLEQSTSHVAYCSSILQSLVGDDSDDEYFDVEKADDQADEAGFLSMEVCEHLSSVKKNLLLFLDKAGVAPSQAPVKTKKKWGPMIAPRMSTRNHGN
ncbi:hypothetical protein ACQ4PT_061905 [Festuca glaucescens]